ncbi:ATP-dependent DNA helicase DDX11 [Vitis vinifera]|uniref:ATP-dependent DNA helicase DDX11 n=1 Tax=Vitis vinifera TaxID=29760 RepID=A0A438DF31_VITVI|nr:ATP-dependent DNA helicase DDX11 [Vitis vinifera]
MRSTPPEFNDVAIPIGRAITWTLQTQHWAFGPMTIWKLCIRPSSYVSGGKMLFLLHLRQLSPQGKRQRSSGEMEESEPPKFPAFPYEPYSIQIDFMKALYRSLNKGGVSMLESPTGTGKTLSIICSALQWLVDRKQQLKSEANQTQTPGGGTGSDDEPDWMKNFVANKDPAVEDKTKKKLRFGKEKPDKGRNQGKFLVEEYESEEEEGVGVGKSKRKAGGVSINSSSDEEEEDDNEEDGEGLKIYFCSRTHSQLSQFVKELRKTIFGNEMKVVCLGSRKISCINEVQQHEYRHNRKVAAVMKKVLKLGNSTRINERCLELQQNKKKEVSKLKNLGSEGRIRRTKASSGCPCLEIINYKSNLGVRFHKKELWILKTLCTLEEGWELVHIMAPEASSQQLILWFFHISLFYQNHPRITWSEFEE